MKILFVLLFLVSCSKMTEVKYHPSFYQNNILHPEYWICSKRTPLYSWGSKETRVECHGSDAELKCREICLK